MEINEAFNRVVTRLEELGIMPKTAPGIEKTTGALRQLNLDIDPQRVIVVAGTNGKGTTSIFLEALLRSAGARVGLYTSPHLVSTNERIRVEGQAISFDKFVEVFAELEPIIEGHGLSHFEALTLMAVSHFVKSRVDYMILEVGLGGLWDATNAVPHRHCVITPIHFDHENLLGSTLESIARNKFGIVGQGAHVTFAPLEPEVRPLQNEWEENTQSVWTPRLPYRCIKLPGPVPKYSLKILDRHVPLPLPGERAAANAALAVTAFQNLGFPVDRHLGALGKVRWPGRMEALTVTGAPCPVYLSGDHNPQGIASLLDLLKDFEYRKLHFLVGIGKDKAAAPMIESLRQFPRAQIHLTETPFKGMNIQDYGEEMIRASESAEASPRKALENILRTHARLGDLVVVTGSLYLVGDIKKHFAPPAVG